jgi:hypothetical protein
MKIEFLKDGSIDCPLIRIFGNEPASAAQLASAFRRLAKRKTDVIAIHEMPGFQPIGGCKLFVRINSEDKGVQSLNTSTFECLLTSDSWGRVAELVDPFTEQLEGDRHQWLDETSEISLLISSSELGKW